MDRLAELERKVRELSTLLEISRTINADLSTERVLTTVLEEAIKAIEAEGGTLWTIEQYDSGPLIVPRAAVGPAAARLLELRLQPGEGIVGRVIMHGAGDLVADAQGDPRWAGHVDVLTGFETRSIVSAPLTSYTGTIGCLQLVNKCNGGLFEASDLDLLTALGAQAALVIENSRLLERTQAFARSLHDAWQGTLDALTSALATRDNDTQAHCYRTVELTVLLGRRMRIAESQIPALARGALLHDVGKIGIPDQILRKPDQLMPEEYELMKQHVRLGYDMLRHIPFFEDAMPVVLYHHENYDGSGYLEGIAGDEIPIGARIFRVVDVYDALISDRPYKPAWTHAQAMDELRKQAGTRFDPAVVEALASLTTHELARIVSLQGFSPEMRALLSTGIRS